MASWRRTTSQHVEARTLVPAISDQRHDGSTNCIGGALRSRNSTKSAHWWRQDEMHDGQERGPTISSPHLPNLARRLTEGRASLGSSPITIGGISNAGDGVKVNQAHQKSVRGQRAERKCDRWPSARRRPEHLEGASPRRETQRAGDGAATRDDLHDVHLHLHLHPHASLQAWSQRLAGRPIGRMCRCHLRICHSTYGHACIVICLGCREEASKRERDCNWITPQHQPSHGPPCQAPSKHCSIYSPCQHRGR